MKIDNIWDNLNKYEMQENKQENAIVIRKQQDVAVCDKLIITFPCTFYSGVCTHL